MELLRVKKGEQAFLLGNEAIARGAVEGGLNVATTYPGTPASEIGDTLYQISKHFPIYFEYSINEKVAVEVAAGASIVGARALSSMKHVGVNVASDPFLTLVYSGVQGAFILVSADDPGCHSSQNEQDNRYYARLSKAPMLEPSTPYEAYLMTKFGFEISHKFRLPLILRTTTRVNHMRAPVFIDGDLTLPPPPFEFKKAPLEHVNVPAIAKTRHPALEKKLKELKKESENSIFNFVIGEGEFGIVTSGISYLYVRDVLKEFGLEEKVAVLKLGFTHPLPDKLIAQFLDGKRRVLVVEELEPYLEEAIKIIAWDHKLDVEIVGKAQGLLPFVGELNLDLVKKAIGELVSQKIVITGYKAQLSIPPRPPIMCPGCPHRATYYAVKSVVGNDAIFPMDIGCYSLAVSPPFEMADFLICMGISVSGGGGSRLGLKEDKPVISFIGDSTFFHSGITGLINAINHKQKFVLIILDNKTTAMTGHQPHPGSSFDTQSVTIDIEEIVKACGVKWIRTVSPYNLRETIIAIKEAIEFDGVSVIISRAPCIFVWSKEEKELYSSRYYEVNPEKCSNCWMGEDRCSVEGIAPVNINRALRRILSDDPQKFIDLSPECGYGCPANVCVQGYIARIIIGDYDGAVEIIREQNPLVAICSYVCHHPCENVCVLGKLGLNPIRIRELKRYAVERAKNFDDSPHLREHIRRAGKQNKDIGIIGSGPAGLSAAYELIRRGYNVTVYEKEREAGGLLRWGIPEYRLPKAVLKRELLFFEKMGVKFRLGVEIGRDITWEELKRRHPAIIIATGATKGVSLAIKGEEGPQVYDAIRYLYMYNLGIEPTIGSRVAVIGGGDAAIDAARVTKRLSPNAHVTIYYRRSLDEMPAREEERILAEKEGVKLQFLLTPKEIVREGELVKGIIMEKLRLSDEKDESGRRRALPTGETVFVEADTVVVAIGQVSELNWLDDLWFKEKGVDNKGRIKVDPETGQSIIEKSIFAAGDVVTGPSTVIDAVASGKIAAYGVDRYFRGDEAPSPRVVRRGKNFSFNISKPLMEQIPEDKVLEEANLCKSCGICAACRNCIQNFACPAMSIVGGKVFIDPNICTGCGVCAQLCPNGAIVEKKR